MAIINDSWLSDNERELVFLYHYRDYKKAERSMQIFAKNEEEAYNLFRKYEGQHAIILDIAKTTAAELKNNV